MDKTILLFGSYEIFTPSNKEKKVANATLPPGVSRRASKIFVRVKLTQAGVPNKNGKKITLSDLTEALPTLPNSYIRGGSHTESIVGSCYNAELLEPEDPHSLAIADYVVWNIPEHKEFVETLLRAYAEGNWGTSYEMIYDHEEEDLSDGTAFLRGPLEFMGACFTPIPAYASTLGFLSLAEVQAIETEEKVEQQIAQLEQEKAALSEVQAALEAEKETLRQQCVALEAERDDWKTKFETMTADSAKKTLAETRLADLGDLGVEDGIDLSELTDAEFTIYKQKREIDKLQARLADALNSTAEGEPPVAKAENISVGKLEDRTADPAVAKKLLDQI